MTWFSPSYLGKLKILKIREENLKTDRKMMFFNDINSAKEIRRINMSSCSHNYLNGVNCVLAHPTYFYLRVLVNK